MAFTSDLQYVLAIMRYGSFSKAADSLFITQPSLSRHIISLEKSLGVLVFDRHSYPVRLTAAGKYYVEEMTSIDAQYSTMLKKLRLLQESPHKNEFSLGIVQWRGGYMLPSLVVPFKRMFPEISITLKDEITSTKLEHQVSSGELDLCIINSPVKNSELELLELYRDRIIIAAPVDHPITRDYRLSRNPMEPTKIDLQSLQGRRFLLQKPEQKLTAQISSFFTKYSILAKKVMEINSIPMLLNLCASDMGLCFLPQQGAEAFASNKNLAFAYVDDPLLYLSVILAYKKGSELSYAESKFIEFTLHANLGYNATQVSQS